MEYLLTFYFVYTSANFPTFKLSFSAHHVSNLFPNGIVIVVSTDDNSSLKNSLFERKAKSYE